MKQLFIDVITKCVPHYICEGRMTYQFDKQNSKEYDYIDIKWFNIKESAKIETSLKLPFIGDRFWRLIPKDKDTPTKRAYVMCVNGIDYPIDLNPVEVNEVDHAIYQIFQNYQISNISRIKDWIKNHTEPKTTEQKFEAAQERVAEDNGN